MTRIAGWCGRYPAVQTVFELFDHFRIYGVDGGRGARREQGHENQGKASKTST